MTIVILSIFSLSQIYAQSASNNTLRTCVDIYMKKFDEAVAKLDQNLQKHKDKLTETSERIILLFLKEFLLMLVSHLIHKQESLDIYYLHKTKRNL